MQFDLGTMMKQKEEAVSGLTKGIEGLFKKNKAGAGAGYGWFVARRPAQRPRPRRSRMSRAGASSTRRTRSA